MGVQPSARTNAMRKPQRSRSTQPASRHALVMVAVVLLAFTYVPHEIIRSGPNISWASLALAIVLAFRYRVWQHRTSGLEVVAWIFGFWILFRLVVVAPLSGEPIEGNQILSDVAPLVAGMIHFRIARIEALRPAAARGLIIGVVIMLLFEGWQLYAGTARLQALGYTTANGFNFYTASGAMRPFGTLLSPTVYAGYLVTVALVAIVYVKRRPLAVLLSLAFTAGLALTMTRAAWIAFFVQLVIIVLFASPKLRTRLIPWVIPGGLLIAVFAIVRWDVVQSLWGRLATVSDNSFDSNTIRETLWSGVFKAVSDRPLVGLGSKPFSEVLYQYIGPTALFGHAHSNYLEQLYLYGWIGGLIFIGLLIAMLVKVIRTGEGMLRVVGAAALMGFMIDSLFEATWQGFGVAATVFLITGLTSATYAMAPRSTSRTSLPVRSHR